MDKPPLTLREIDNQLQIMEYIATNTQQGLTPSDRIILRRLENRKNRLLQQQGTPRATSPLTRASRHPDR